MIENSPDRTRLLYLIFGVVLLMYGMVGQLNSIPTLGFSLVIASLLLILSFWFRRHFTLYLIDFWILGYVYLFLSEYINLNTSTLLGFNQIIRNISEGFIVASFGASILGYGLIIHFVFARWAYSKFDATTEPVTHSKNFSYSARPNFRKQKQVKQHETKHVITTVEQHVKEPLPGIFVMFLLGMSVLVIFYITELVGFRTLLYEGRLEQSPYVTLGNLANIFIALVVSFPLITAFAFSRYQAPFALLMIWVVAVSFLAILAMFASGTRLYLGFQLGGLLFFVTKGFRFDRNRFVIFVFLLLTLVSSQVIMRYTRDAGIGNVSTSELLDITRQANNYFSYEGILSVNALIHATRVYNNNDSRLPETLFILYWWIPRQIWSEKPTMAGYWLIRELSSQMNFSSSHSVDGGFAMPALLDFGPIWGALFCVMYGVGIAVLEVYMWRHRNLQHPGAILAALLCFGVFFMMRSLYTSLIFIILMTIISVLPLQIFTQLFLSKHRPRYGKSFEPLGNIGSINPPSKHLG